MDLDIMAFLTSVTVALAGAFSLWGWLFSVKTRRSENPAWDVLTKSIFFPVFWCIWLLILIFTVNLIIKPVIALAYEGVVAIPALLTDQVNTVAMPIVLLLCVIGVAGIWLYAKKDHTVEQLEWYYFISFIFVLLYAFAPVFASFDLNGWFYAVHRMEPILTLGTVIVAIWLCTTQRDRLQILPQLLPAMYKFMMLGIAVEFIKTITVVNASLALDDTFFFMQLVLAFIIMVGVLFVDPWTKTFTVRASKRMQERENIALAVIPISWLTLLAVDASTSFSCSFKMAFLIFVGIMALLWLFIRAIKGRYGC